MKTLQYDKLSKSTSPLVINDSNTIDDRPPLTDEQIQRINQGLSDIREGKCMPHIEHKKDFREWLKKEHDVAL